MNTNDKTSFWDKKPFEKTKTPQSPEEEKTLKDVLNSKPKWLSFDYNFEEFSDRIRFMITFVILGLGVVFLGDVFKLISFKATAVVTIIIGILLILTGFVAPIAKWLNDNM